MGLDMYLIHVPKGAEPAHGPWPEPADYSGDRDGYAAVNELAYWRKANQVHAFFVEHCADGTDDCRPVLVHPEVLADLVQRCEAVLADPALAPELLPTRGGFFFGDTDYDEYYLTKLKDTVEMLTRKVLKNPSIRGHDLYYEASW